MIQLSDISLNFGSKQLFDSLNFSLKPGSRTALYGPNGSGKTTLLNIISGREMQYQGQINRPSSLSIGYLRQELDQDVLDESVLAVVLSGRTDLLSMEQEMRDLEASLSREADEGDMKRYSELQELYRHQEGYEYEAKARRILGGLGFPEDSWNRPVSSFSGGWRMRISMAHLLLKNPSLLLLDEPTNHLDLDTLVWFENFLMDYTGTIVMVSHDRYFLDRLSTHVAEIDQGALRLYPGNFSEFEDRKEVEYRQMEARIRNQEKRRKQIEDFIERFRYKATKARQVQSRLKMLNRETQETLSSERRHIRFSFPPSSRSGDPVLQIRDLTFAYGSTPVFQNVNMEIRRGERIALVGENGSGKSTLIRLIIGELTAKSGQMALGQNLKIAYFAQHQLQNLHPDSSILEEIRSSAPDLSMTQLRSALGNFLFSGDDVDKKISILSGGEKSRVVLLKILLSRANVIVMDEPTNHLDMESREILAEALDAYDGTLCLVSHDRFFLDMLVSRIYAFSGGTLTAFTGNYSEFEIWKAEKLQTEAKPAETPRENLRDRKRREAEIRKKKFDLKKDLVNSIKALESEIKSLESEQNDLTELLSSSAFSSLNADEKKSKTLRFREVRTELNEKEGQWLELSERIEVIDNMEL